MSTTADLSLLRRKLAAADYSPDIYVRELASRCVGGHELEQQRKNIQTLSEDTHSHLKRNVFENYKQFIETAKEISFLESEMYQLSHMITEQRNILSKLGQTSILGDKVPSALELGENGSGHPDVVYEGDLPGDKSKRNDFEEGRRKLYDLLDKVEGCSHVTDVPNRFLLHEGDLVEMDLNENTALHRVHGYLLNDGFMIATWLPNRRGPIRFKFSDLYELDSLAVVNVRDLGGLKFAFKLLVYPDARLFQCANESAKKDWMESFEDAKKRRQKEQETQALKRSDTITQRERKSSASVSQKSPPPLAASITRNPAMRRSKNPTKPAAKPTKTPTKKLTKKPGQNRTVPKGSTRHSHPSDDGSQTNPEDLPAVEPSIRRPRGSQGTDPDPNLGAGPSQPHLFSEEQEQAIARMIEAARAQERASLLGTSVQGGQLSNAAPTDSSEDEDEEQDVSDCSFDNPRPSKSRKYGKNERAIPPTLYWIGQGQEPTSAGRLAGSREKFADRRCLAKERVNEMRDICKGTMPIMRHAQSHLLLGFQLRETRRLLHLVETRLYVERGLRSPTSLKTEASTNEILSHLRGALQVGIDSTRHEIAMAEILSVHGEKVMTQVEGRKPRDSRYSSRTDWVLKEMKKDDLQETLMRHKSVGLTPPNALALKGSQASSQGPRSLRGRRGRKPSFWRDQTGSTPGLTKNLKNPLAIPKCYNCGTPGHLTRECPKKKLT